MKTPCLLYITIACILFTACAKSALQPSNDPRYAEPPRIDPFFLPAQMYISQYENGDVTYGYNEEIYNFSLTLAGYSHSNELYRPPIIDSIAYRAVQQIFWGIDEYSILRSMERFNFKVAHEMDTTVYNYSYSLQYDLTFQGLWATWPFNHF